MGEFAGKTENVRKMLWKYHRKAGGEILEFQEDVNLLKTVLKKRFKSCPPQNYQSIKGWLCYKIVF